VSIVWRSACGSVLLNRCTFWFLASTTYRANAEDHAGSPVSFFGFPTTEMVVNALGDE
jgi:hypothetical protein